MLDFYPPVRDQWGHHGIEQISRAFWEVLMGTRAPFSLELGPGLTWTVRPWWYGL
jgi:hypothetical protein